MMNGTLIIERCLPQEIHLNLVILIILAIMEINKVIQQLLNYVHWKKKVPYRTIWLQKSKPQQFNSTVAQQNYYFLHQQQLMQ